MIDAVSSFTAQSIAEIRSIAGRSRRWISSAASMSDMPAPQHAEFQADKRRDFDTDKCYLAWFDWD